MLVPQHGLAMTTRRRMHETGTTSAHFGAAAVAIRGHANRNPRATFYDQPLTLEDHQSSALHRGGRCACSTAAWRRMGVARW